MDVLIDGIIFEMQSRGGISRIFHEILPRMCDQEPRLQVTLVTQEKLMQPLPVHPQIAHEKLVALDKVLRPRPFWNRYKAAIRGYLESRMPANDVYGIFHSTYYVYPERWRGAVVATVYDMIHEFFRTEYFPNHYEAEIRARKKACLTRADVIVAISDTTRVDAGNFYEISPERIHVVPLSHNPEFRVLPGERKEASGESLKPFLLYVGNREKYKNFATLLKAYRNWKQRGEVNLLAVGPAWTKEESRLMSEPGLAGSVHVLTNIDDVHLCRLYNQAAALVFPSLYEGFGLPLLEAMACGCPIVASDIPSTREVAGECPIYFEAQDVDQLIDALEMVMAEGRNSERVKAGLIASRMFSWDKTAQATLDVYRLLSPD
jgi:glycosyltransferase involved in cell wall biosynthesis